VEHWLFTASSESASAGTAWLSLHGGSGEWERYDRVAEAVSTLLGPEGTGTGRSSDFPDCSCLQAFRVVRSPGWWAGPGRAGRSGLHTASDVSRGFVRGLVLVVVVGWCPFVF
jgi:hypothetical protein